jgi:phospholipase/lecithinase/hemolysin
MRLSLAIATLTALTTSVSAAVKNVVVFADSYTDNGNDYKHSGFPPSPPYYEGRFSNGPTWLEYVAKSVSVPVTNVGHGGATTNNDDVYSEFNGWTVPGLIQQIETIPVEGSTDTLFIIEIGYNDLNAIINPDQYKVVNKDLTYQKITENIVTGVKNIQDKYNGTNFAIYNCAPFDEMPVVTADKKPDAKKLINDFNAYTMSELKKVDGAEFKFYDLHAWFVDSIANYKSLGYKDTSYCAVGIGNTTACDNPEDHFFWDYYHPESKVHKAWGDWSTKQLMSDYGIN